VDQLVKDVAEDIMYHGHPHLVSDLHDELVAVTAEEVASYVSAHVTDEQSYVELIEE
jgi:hypothetical protein